MVFHSGILDYHVFTLGMIEQTVLEIARQRFWAWQRRQAVTPKTQLRETDELLGLVEECRLQRFKLIPAPVWRRIIHLLGQLGDSYTSRLGIDRSVERTSEILFEAQAALMDQATAHRQRRNVIPLFGRQT